MILSWRKKPTVGDPTRVLAPGWQFYARPTTHEPPGTVFRIDGNGVRFLVGEMKVATRRGDEAARLIKQTDRTLGLLARIVGAGAASAEAGGSALERLEFELHGAVRETVTDRDLDAALEPFLADMHRRPAQRYFVIREALAATAMTYRLSSGLLGKLGGEAALAATLSAGATLSAERDGLRELSQTFVQSMRVMFLPEELREASAGLAAEQPKVGRVPVREVLTWREGGRDA